MPELPDLEVLCEHLGGRIVGVSIASVLVRRPIVVRNLLGGDLADHLVDRRFAGLRRRGKYLILSLDDGHYLVIHPQMAGRIHHGAPLQRDRKRDAFVLHLSDGSELRYNDARDMGQVYVTDDLDRLPEFAHLGPEATDPDLTLELFAARLRKQRGEIKDVLTRQSFLAGIGSAYADEILWRAGLYPFRRRSTLTDEDVALLYEALRAVLVEAVVTLRAYPVERTDVEIRDFLAVHGRPGQPCPRCGSTISEVTRARRPTHFCRTCQPGLIVGSR